MAEPQEAPSAGEARLGWWLALWLVAVAGLIAGSLNPVTKPPGEYHIDKFAHLLAYAGLAGLPALVLRRMRTVLLAAVILVAIGCSVEVLQHLVPGRQGSVGDALANAVGVVLGVVAGRQARVRLPWMRRGRV